jgi:coenzyme F420-reducing hydrogenase gamma subunit
VTHRLVVIGACATAGGIQAIRNWFDHDAIRSAVYPQPEYVDSLARARPVADFVAVDAELRGCPISPSQLREYLVALVTGRRPQLPDEAVCVECKRRGIVCVAVAEGIPCLGPVTRTGCGALCPAYDRGCYGCFGPRESANTRSLAAWLGSDRESSEVARLFAGFTAWSGPFRSVIDAHGGPPGPPPPDRTVPDA